MSVMKRRIAKNTTALFATRIINQVAGFLLVVYASRRLGVEDFGKYSFVVAFYLVFELISFFGLQNFLPREIGRRRAFATRRAAPKSTPTRLPPPPGPGAAPPRRGRATRPGCLWSLPACV